MVAQFMTHVHQNPFGGARLYLNRMKELSAPSDA